MDNKDEELPSKQQKMFTTCLQGFELHGKTFKEGELISFSEANYLIQNMQEAKLISPLNLETN